MLTFASAFDKNAHTTQNGAVVQLVRTSACHAGGRGFESRPHRFKMLLRYLGSIFVAISQQRYQFLRT